jgi:hypothetical protein
MKNTELSGAEPGNGWHSVTVRRCVDARARQSR